ncbi:hypothetical protein D3C71_904180 [compost metagenome]
MVSVDVFFSLKAEERATQQHGDRQPQFQRTAMAFFQGVVGDGHGDAGTHQQHGVEQRQAPRADDIFGWRKEFGIRVVQQRPGKFEVRPQHVGDAFGAFTTERRPGNVAHIKQRTEEGDEEHHLREDEPAHAPAERAIHLCAVQAAATFLDHRAEPAKQHVGQQQATDEKDQRPVGFRTRCFQIIEPGGQAKHRDEHPDRGDDRPFALGRNVIMFMSCHLLFSLSGTLNRQCLLRPVDVGR